MVYIRELLVSPDQEEHIWVGHRVTVEEVEDVCFSEPYARRGREESYAMYGQTAGGRYLIVFLYPRGHGVFSLATARNMTDIERRHYRRAKGR